MTRKWRTETLLLCACVAGVASGPGSARAAERVVLGEEFEATW